MRPGGIAALIGALAFAASAPAAEEGKANADAIGSAKAALQSLKASGSVPGADQQGVPTVEAPAMIIPSTSSTPSLSLSDLRRDPSAAAKAVQSGRGWLVDAMTKDQPDAASGPASSDALSPLTLPDSSPAAARSSLSDLAPPPAGPNPFTEYLSAWLSPKDYSLFAAPGAGPSGGSLSLSNGDSGAGGLLGSPGAPQAPLVPIADLKDNPFLQALSVPAAPQREAIAPPTVDAPVYRPTPETAPAPARNEPPIDFSKRTDDQKYFPQLKRF